MIEKVTKILSYLDFTQQSMNSTVAVIAEKTGYGKSEVLDVLYALEHWLVFKVQSKNKAPPAWILNDMIDPVSVWQDLCQELKTPKTLRYLCDRFNRTQDEMIMVLEHLGMNFKSSHHVHPYDENKTWTI